jgi:phosphocarrier protein
LKRIEAAIVNRLGLHARPSAALTQTATRFKSDVWLSKGSRRVNGKSIMGVMMLAAARGTTLVIEADGPDEDAALTALAALIGSGFGEGVHVADPVPSSDPSAGPAGR